MTLNVVLNPDQFTTIVNLAQTFLAVAALGIAAFAFSRFLRP